MLAEHQHIKIQVTLTDEERDRYEEFIATRNAFLRNNNIFLGSIKGMAKFCPSKCPIHKLGDVP